MPLLKKSENLLKAPRMLEENIFSLSEHFVPVKLTILKSWSDKCWLYSWSTYTLSFAFLKIMLAVCATVFLGFLKVLKISPQISRNVSLAEVALLAQKLFSSIVSIKEHKYFF